MRLFEKSDRKKVDQLRAKKDIKGLMKLLGTTRGSDYLETRKHAAIALRYMDGPVIDSLIDGLHNTNIDIRCGSASILGQIGNSESYKHLIKLLDDPNDKVQRTVLAVIRGISDDKLITSLLDTLPSLGKQGKDCVLKLMEHVGDSRAVDLLLEMMPTAQNDQKKSIIRSLGNIGDPKAIPLLIEELSKEEWPGLAAHALGQIGKSEAVEALISALEEPHNYWNMFLKKLNVIIALGMIKDVKAVDPLISLLGDNAGGYDPAPNLTNDFRHVEPLLSNYGTVAGAAAAALGKIGDKKAIEPLIQALQKGGTDLRSQAVRALADIGDPTALKVLDLAAHQDPDSRVRKVALAALVTLQKKKQT